MGTLLAACILVTAGSGAAADGASLVGHGTSGKPAQPLSGVDDQSAPDGVGARATSSFSISGSAAGLFPGKTVALVLTVTNPFTVSITVTSITATVSNASSGCVAAKLKVTSFSGHLLIGAGKARKVTLKVSMYRSAPNACQGAEFPFQYAGLATAA
jgi:hypothetical protein